MYICRNNNVNVKNKSGGRGGVGGNLRAATGLSKSTFTSLGILTGKGGDIRLCNTLVPKVL